MHQLPLFLVLFYFILSLGMSRRTTILIYAFVLFVWICVTLIIQPKESIGNSHVMSWHHCHSQTHKLDGKKAAGKYQVEVNTTNKDKDPNGLTGPVNTKQPSKEPQEPSLWSQLFSRRVFFITMFMGIVFTHLQFYLQVMCNSF